MSISLEKLHSDYDIPLEELEGFRDMIRVYSSQDVIIEEGSTEKAMYLLRHGSVKVFKRSGDAQKFMTMIDAINIFGELSVINNEPRTATVIAMSDKVIVYRIADPDPFTIAHNPFWAELMITRLSQSLARNLHQLLAASETIRELRAEVERLKAGTK